MPRKSTKKAKAPSEPLPELYVIDPRIYLVLETLCKDAIRFGGNHAAVRQAISAVCQQMRLASQKRFGFDTPDTMAIAALLRRTDPANEVAGNNQPRSLDTIQDLNTRRQ